MAFWVERLFQTTDLLRKRCLILSSKNVDLRDQQATMRFFEENTGKTILEVLVHCAVQGGGIGWMKDHPVSSC